MVGGRGWGQDKTEEPSLRTHCVRFFFFFLRRECSQLTVLSVAGGYVNECIVESVVVQIN